jgi:phytoene synthase
MHGRDTLQTSKEIQRRTGRTFHLATRLLPEWARHPTYVLYAFFRVADEVVDDPEPGPPAEQRAELERIRTGALGARDLDADDDTDRVLAAVRELAERHDIDDVEIDEFVDAMAMDVEQSSYDTAADLDGYLRGSSVAVAYMMLSVMDPPEAEAARPHAEALGEAFQLTNFVRDVREDVLDYDRVYLPRETLRRHGATEADVRALRFDTDVAAAVRAELERTEARYREGVAGIRHLPADCRLAVLAAATLYAEHHRLIRRRGFDVVSERPTLSMPRRLWVLARTWLHYRRTGDPEATFYRVAPIGEEPESEEVPVGGADPSRGRLARLVGPTRALAGTMRSWLPSGWG